MAFRESSIARDVIGRFSAKRGSSPEVSLGGGSGFAAPEPDAERRTTPLYTSAKNTSLFVVRERLAEDVRRARDYDAGSPQGADYVAEREEPLRRFDEKHPEIAGLGTRIVDPTPEQLDIREGYGPDGKKLWRLTGPDKTALVARRSGFRKFSASFSEDSPRWEGRTPEEALAAAYAGVQSDEVRQDRLARTTLSSMADRDLVAELRYRMGYITATERKTPPIY